jgi:hypothetical protein
MRQGSPEIGMVMSQNVTLSSLLFCFHRCFLTSVPQHCFQITGCGNLEIKDRHEHDTTREPGAQGT